MKLSNETLAIMKNFAGINSNLLLKAGDRLTTISPAKNVMAVAKIAEKLPINGTGAFGIYELNDFLSAYSLLESPDISFADKYLLIERGNQKIRFYSADTEMILSPAKESLPVNEDVSFSISKDNLDMINKTASVLKASDVSVVSEDGRIKVIVGDKKNNSSNNFTIDLGASTTKAEFKVYLKAENLAKLVVTDYTVAVDSKKLSKFTATKGSIVYYVAIEADSIIKK